MMLFTPRLKNLVSTLTSLLFVSCSLPAFAAETTTWQGGPYIGAYLGEAFGSDHITTNAASVTDTDLANPTNINSINNAGTYNNSPNSMIAGIQAGQDWVWKKIVYGVVLDYSTLPLSSSKSVNNVAYSNGDGQYSINTAMSTNWLFTLRGRLGYQFMLSRQPSLLYVTGGMALTNLKVTNNFNDTSSLERSGASETSNNQIGWTVGAGIEVPLYQHVSANLEYSYIDVPSVNTTSTISNTAPGFAIPVGSQTSSFSTTGQFHASLLKLGLKYLF